MEEKIKRLLSELTLEEKAALCSGITSWKTTPIDRLGIPWVFMADGPHGVRKEQEQTSFGNVFMPAVPSTCFPPAVTLASSWDRELLGEVGKALGEEAMDEKVATVLGPGVNIKRSPLCGRNFEYFSEDPYLAGELAVAYVNGLQSTGVGTSLKHFAVNSQEFRRMNATSEVDERTLREIYLYAFEKTVKEARPYTVMCSYNALNGIHVSQNKYLLYDILRKEWGYEGLVISDWGAVADRVEGIKAGMNLQMPTSNGEDDTLIVKAVREGKLEEAKLDETVERVLEYVFKCHENNLKVAGYKADFEAHHALARKAAANGAVLLKNDGILPISAEEDIAVIGSLARDIRAQGSGSSRLNMKNKVSFTQYLDSISKRYAYAEGYNTDNDTTTDAWIAEAGACAKNAKVALVFIGLTDAFESESFDRQHLNIPESHLRLLDEVLKNNQNVVVVLTGGSPSLMPYLNRVKAVLNVYLTGEAGGESTYDLLTGAVNPSGKLAETFPISLEDVLCSPYYGKESAEYREGIYVGYRYADTAKKEVLFPFGFGLSYTQFEYSDLRLSADSITDKDALEVSFTVKNVGKVAGAEVAEVYVKDKESTLFVAEKELKGFAKVFLGPGEEKRVVIALDKRSFAYYNVLSADWAVESGDFDILVGASSRDIKLTATVSVTAAEQKIPDYKASAPAYYDIANRKEIPLAEFEALLGRPVNAYVPSGKGEYTFNTCIGQLNQGCFAKLVKRVAFKYSVQFMPKDSPTSQKKMVQYGAMDLPVRNMAKMSNGAVSQRMAEGILSMLNGKFFGGIGKLISGACSKPKAKIKIYGEKK